MIIAMSVDYNSVLFDIVDEDPEDLKGPLRRHYDLLKSYEAEGKYLGGYYLPGEDRAELMRVLLNAPWDETTLWELLPSSHVRAKYERYFDILHEAFEDVDREETPWERLYKELLQRYGIS